MLVERIISALKRNLGFAFGRVFRGWREYLWFFAALFIIQSALCLVAFSFDSTLVSRSGGKTEGDAWHVCYMELNDEQKDVILGIRPSRAARGYYEKAFMKTRTVNGELRCDVYIRFTKPDYEKAREYLAHDVERFLGMFDDDGSISVRYSPEYKLYLAQNDSKGLTLLGFGVAFAISLLFLCVLYGIRTRQEKFVFGVYITWGADTRRLALTSGTELFVCALTTFLPAAICGAMASAACAALAGGVFYLKIRLCFAVLVCVAAASFLAAYIRTRALSLSSTASLLASSRGADIVSSHRGSVMSVRKSFPAGYERLSLWRFRGFIISTALSFALCAAVFFFAVTCADSLEKSRAHLAEYGAEYTLTLDDSADHAVAYEGLMSIDGVLHVTEEAEYEDARFYSHLISMQTSSVKKRGLAAANPYLDGESLTDYFRIYACDPTTAISLADVYDMDGDVTDFADGYDVIVGETSENATAYSFNPGDKLTVWIYVNARGTIEDGSAGVYKISQMAENYIYKTVTLTVKAVIKNAPSANSGFALYVSDGLYAQLTGKVPTHTVLDIAVDSESNAAAEIRALNEFWSLGSLEYTGTQTDTSKKSAEAWAETLVFTAYAVVAISVLPLLYSLALFYRKRATEIAILRAMFAENRTIVKLLLCDIPVFFAACVLISLPLCFASVKCAAAFCDRVLPNIFFADLPVITSASPSIVLFTVILVASLLSVASSVLVYCARATGDPEADEKNLYAE